MKAGLAAIAFASGMALASQVGMNNALRGRMHHPILAALASFTIGTTILIAYAAILRPAMPSRSDLAGGPWWMWCGGLVGAFYVAASSIYASKLGAAAWLGLIVAGQITASLLMDHFGLIGFPRKPVNLAQLAGAALLVAGVVLVLRGRAEPAASPSAVEPESGISVTRPR